MVAVRVRDASKWTYDTSESGGVSVAVVAAETGKLISQLTRVHYDRALSVDILPVEGVDQFAEMRKMRLLLESLL